VVRHKEAAAAGTDLSIPAVATAVAGKTIMKRALIEDALRRLAPKIPPHEFGAVVDHALDSRGLRGASPETAAWLSLVAYVRHTLTEYDDLLTQGYDQDSARYFVADEIRAVLAAWGAKRTLGEEE
jgi:hypothetical protein